MTEQPAVDAERVREFADRLSLAVTADEAERFASEIDRGLDRYDELHRFGADGPPGMAGADESTGTTRTTGSTATSPTTPSEVVFELNRAADPHYAFISLFELQLDAPDDDALTGWDIAVKDNIAGGPALTVPLWNSRWPPRRPPVHRRCWG